ncbi:MAG: hypothetical protein A2589_01550 [Candidatus Vogelbacteria bacterium RIFOXYD1_FULL_46_19]|uniref:YdbS-like PH domain-containing protein n=1 Tax=Candidatus Vogelbacteria bacterium RIFOXYD1_FULL_46_19 TaxID=1802439 RepID=A0A1G2QGJ9_9BACT|nr:MAG: hypothetical protein A2589_01550 [Candidatus Vogelbacteria bacterium RIFOXYD1_FULL_46_19]
MNKTVHLETGEEIIAEVRKHWFIFLLEGLASLAAALGPLIIIPICFNFAGTELNSRSFYILAFFYSTWLALVWIYFFVSWTDYYLDVWLLTNEKIIDIEQKGIFHREVSTFRLERIQDVTVEIPGFLATLLDYGHLHVQTAGEQREFIIYNAAQPGEVKKKILSAYRRPATDPSLNA